MSTINRRDFLRSASAMAVSAGMLGSLTSNHAFAADTQGYKALVCVFLFGGMDHNDTILPMDPTSYELFSQRRPELMESYNYRSTSSSRHINNLLPLQPNNGIDLQGRNYGLPSQLQPLHDLFNNQELAIVGSVGPLVEPVTRTQFQGRSVALPKRLFSHNDQQSTWMALNVEGARIGWGGRLLDSVLANDNSLNPSFMGISTNANSTFLSGETTTGFSVSSNGQVKVNPVEQRGILGSANHYNGARERLSAFLQQADLGNNNVFEQDASRLQARGVTNGSQFADAFASVPQFATAFPTTGLGRQLKTVAETIAVRDSLDAKRQVFFVGIGGFDSHSDQAQTIPALHTQIAGGIKAFRDAMVEQGLWNDVTLFTASDFGRTLNGNGDGTDHGWGGHHFVAGGSVQGGNIYGHLPSPDTGSSDYTDNRGRLIPRVSVEQYAATMGNWFGLEQNRLAQAFPNLANFAVQDLGFMG